MKNTIKAGKFLKILKDSRMKSDYPHLYKKYYSLIEACLRGFEDCTLEGLSSLEGLTDKTEFDSFLRFDILGEETKDSKERTVDNKFSAILAEVTTWHDCKVEAIKECLNQDGEAVKEAIDGETISKWTAFISAILTLLLGSIASYFGMDYDKIAFYCTGGTAIITLVVVVIAGICNLALRKKFHSSYGISIVKAKSLIITEEEYEKEIKEAIRLCGTSEHPPKKSALRKAKHMFNKALDYNPKDANGYVGLLRIASNNFTEYRGPQIKKYIEAIEKYRGQSGTLIDNDYEEYKTKYAEYWSKEEAKRFRTEKIAVAKSNDKKLRRQIRKEKCRERLEHAIPILQQIGIYIVLILPIVFSIVVSVLTFCMPVKSFDDYTGWLYTIFFAVDCLSVLAVFAMWIALSIADRNPKFDGFGVGGLGAGACSFGAEVGYFAVVLSFDSRWWVILLFVVISTAYSACLIRGLLSYKEKCIPRFLLVCLVGIIFGSAIGFAVFDSFPNFVKSTRDYYMENSDGTYTYVICDRNTENLEIPSEYREKPITAVNRDAHIELSRLKSVVIPDSVTSIARSVFTDCPIQVATIPAGLIGDIPHSKLTTITVTSGVIGDYAFWGCSGLTSIEIGDGVTSIGDHAFVDCSGLTSITIPDSVTTIGWRAFSRCSKLVNITLPYVGYFETGAVTGYDGEAEFLGPIGFLFDGVSYDGGIAVRQAFWGKYISGNKEGEEATFITTYYIPASLKCVTVLGGEVCYGAFSDCTNLESVTLGDGVTSIGQNSFLNCGAVHKARGISYIDKWVVGCDDTVTEVELSGDTVGIADFAFANCKSLASVILNNGLKIIGGSAFQGTNITSLVIPQSVSTIGGNAFSECTLLNVVFENVEEWYADGIYVPSSKLSDPPTASGYLTSTYVKCMWQRG